MNFGSLFTGIGGFDLGFERAGMDCAWQVEIDKDCQRVLAKRWPNVERFSDVTTVERLPGVDVLCGGFPCQDLSVAGQRKGLAGERSGLWFEFLRIIATNLPEWIVVENVPGILSAEDDNDVPFRCVCGWTDRWRRLHLPVSEPAGERQPNGTNGLLREHRDWNDISRETHKSHINGGGQVAVAFDYCLQGSDRTFIHRKNGQAQLQANRPDAVAGNFGVRRLTPRECERLQGFPDDFTRYDANEKEISDSARYRMLGNAVCVSVAEWVGKRLLETLRTAPKVLRCD